MNICHSQYLIRIYERKAQNCKNRLNEYAADLIKDGKPFTDIKIMHMNEQYQMWLSALYDIQCLLILEGYETDCKRMPTLKETLHQSSFTYDQRRYKLEQMLRLSKKDSVIFISGCMMLTLWM